MFLVVMSCPEELPFAYHLWLGALAGDGVDVCGCTVYIGRDFILRRNWYFGKIIKHVHLCSLLEREDRMT